MFFLEKKNKKNTHYAAEAPAMQHFSRSGDALAYFYSQE